jgi:hypothetical protein
MAGLPEDSLDLFLHSVGKSIAICPDFVRIYPALVLRGTALADWLAAGSYLPLSLEDAVAWVAKAYDMFLEAGIPVVRMGLHADPSLEKPGVVVAGPYHRSFGYLVRCRWWRDRVDTKFSGLSSTTGGAFVLRVASNLVSEVTGPGKSNIEHWKSAWKLGDIRVIAGDAPAGTEMDLRTVGL